MCIGFYSFKTFPNALSHFIFITTTSILGIQRKGLLLINHFIYFSHIYEGLEVEK